MTRFTDGPAKGHPLCLKRGPRYLRVVVDECGNWDALDQPGDTASPTEKLYAYEVQGEVGWCHVLRRPRGSGWFVTADYAMVKEQPPEAVMRDQSQWEQWCEQRFNEKGKS